MSFAHIRATGRSGVFCSLGLVSDNVCFVQKRTCRRRDWQGCRLCLYGDCFFGFSSLPPGRKNRPFLLSWVFLAARPEFCPYYGKRLEMKRLSATDAEIQDARERAFWLRKFEEKLKKRRAAEKRWRTLRKNGRTFQIIICRPLRALVCEQF